MWLPENKYQMLCLAGLYGHFWSFRGESMRDCTYALGYDTNEKQQALQEKLDSSLYSDLTRNEKLNAMYHFNHLVENGTSYNEIWRMIHEGHEFDFPNSSYPEISLLRMI